MKKKSIKKENKKEQPVADDKLCFSENTKIQLESLVRSAKNRVAEIESILQREMALIVVTFKDTKGIKGDYNISKDFTKLEKVIKKNA